MHSIFKYLLCLSVFLLVLLVLFAAGEKGLIVAFLIILVSTIFYYAIHKPFILFIPWLLVAPVAPNIIMDPSSNPFFKVKSPDPINMLHSFAAHGYLSKKATSIKISEIITLDRLILTAIAATSLLTSLVKNRRLFLLDRTEIYMIAFSIIILINAFLYSHNKNFAIRVAGDAFIFPFLAYHVSKTLIKDYDRFYRLTNCSVYIACYLVIACLFERLLNSGIFYRMHGPFNAGTTLGQVTSIIFFMILYQLTCQHSHNNDTFHHVLYKLMLLSIPLIVFLTLSRGLWFALILGLIVYTCWGQKFLSYQRKVLAIGLLLVALPTMIVILELQKSSIFISKRVENVDNIVGRVATYRAVLKGAEFKPMFGIGLNNTRDILGHSRVSYMGVNPNLTTHNSFLSLGLELGLIGLLSYGLIMASIVHFALEVYRRKPNGENKSCGITIICVVITYLTPGLFANTIELTGFSHIVFYIILGAFAGVYQIRRVPTPQERRWGPSLICES